MRGKLFLLSILSGLLLAAAWPPYGFSPLLFVAFIPLMLVQHIVQTDNRLRARHLFLYSYITFLIWNGLTTWWVLYASAGAGAMANLANALLMSLVFLVYHKVRLHLPQRYSAFALIAIWVTFEWLHHDWDLTWPWLTLGNAFAGLHSWIQWYEFTGTFGGSIWVLLINVLLFELFVYRNTSLRPVKKRLWYGITCGAVVIVPIVSSLIYYHTLEKATGVEKINVTVVQPNIDPYNEKFAGGFQKQLQKMLMLAAEKTDEKTDYLVLPETALVESLWEDNLPNTWSIRELRRFLKKYPNLKIVSGASTYKRYEPGEKLSATARKFEQMEGYYDAYNTGIQLDADSTQVQVYHKSKLVPGVEKMPFPAVFKYLEKFAVDLGGISGSLGMQDERTVFKSAGSTTGVAPVICYESIYGEYVTQYIKNGADFIFIITNDGWWDDTPGYKQHLLYGRLRSIETRKGIARSANTGISCFISPRGDISQQTGWWVPAVIRAEVTSFKGETFYTRWGDYLPRIGAFISLFAISAAFFRWLRKRKKKTAQPAETGH